MFNCTTKDESRFSSYIEADVNGCWIWTGPKDRYGYGSFIFKGKEVIAHRFSYALRNNVPMSSFLPLDHLCKQKDCVNPDHLQEVTAKVNNQRRFGADEFKCRNGHSRTAENTYHDGKGPRCLPCKKELNSKTSSEKQFLMRELGLTGREFNSIGFVEARRLLHDT